MHRPTTATEMSSQTVCLSKHSLIKQAETIAPRSEELERADCCEVGEHKDEIINKILDSYVS